MRHSYRHNRLSRRENLITCIVDTESSYGGNHSEPVKV